MTLKELQDVLGETVKAVCSISVNCDTSTDEVKAIYGKADSIARLAKQMINNADVVLRTDKLISEGKISKEDTIAKMVGE